MYRKASALCTCSASVPCGCARVFHRLAWEQWHERTGHGPPERSGPLMTTILLLAFQIVMRWLAKLQCKACCVASQKHTIIERVSDGASVAGNGGLGAADVAAADPRLASTSDSVWQSEAADEAQKVVAAFHAVSARRNQICGISERLPEGGQV